MESLEELYLSSKQVIKFIETIPSYDKLEESSHYQSPMSVFQWQVYFACCYYLCIRPGAEALRLRKKDFNIQSGIVSYENRKRGYTKTTIPPPLIKPLKKYLGTLKEDDLLFKGTRQTFWKYTKAIGKLAGITYFEEFEKRETEGLYTYVFKHAYIQRLESEGCPPSLISIKSRHRGDGRMARQTVNYAKSLRGLKIWESQNITEELPI